MTALLLKRLWPLLLAAAVLIATHAMAYRQGGASARASLAEAKAQHADVLRQIADKTLAAERQVRAAGEAWASAIAAQDAKSTKELSDEKSENDRLRRAARAGTARVHINGAICANDRGVPQAAADPGLGAGETEAQGELRERVFDLREAVIAAEAQIEFLQGYARACAGGPPAAPGD